MTLVRRILGCISLLIFLNGASAARGEIVYNNTTTTNQNVAFYSPFEFGDEIFLAGTSRIINEFRFDYHGNFQTPTNGSTATIRVRFYANDGQLQFGARLPGTKLFDSGEFPVFSGYNSVVLAGLAVKVPDDFTWTVQFGGILDGNVGNRAGLRLFSPPSVGNSYADFWIKGTQGWTILEFSSGLVANFNGIFFATSENTITLAPPTRLASGAYQLLITGPQGRSVMVQASSDLSNWESLARVTLPGNPLTYVDNPKVKTTARYYRVMLLSDEPISVSNVTRQPNGWVQLDAKGPAGLNFALQATTDFANWTTVTTGIYTSRTLTLTDTNAARFPNRFYRSVIIPGR